LAVWNQDAAEIKLPPLQLELKLLPVGAKARKVFDILVLPTDL